jgi:hypothetical protein
LRASSSSGLRAPQSFLDDQVQHFKGITGGGLVGLIVTDQTAKKIGGENFGRAEMLAGKGGLAATGRPHEQHQAQFRHHHRGSFQGTGCRAAHGLSPGAYRIGNCPSL